MHDRDGGRNAQGGIGDLIRSFRKVRGLTQMELSEKLGVSYQQVQKYEYGKSELTVSRLRQIAWALGVPVHAFLAESAEGGRGERLSEDDARALALLKEIEAKGLKPMAIRILEAMAE